MSSETPRKCPSCGGNMRIQNLRCPSCATEVQGDFPLSRFSKLNEEQLAFLETFIQCRGSLKDVGAVIGISYPTARNRLDNLVEALDFSNKDALAERRLEILGQLKNGEIGTEEALELLGGKND